MLPNLLLSYNVLENHRLGRTLRRKIILKFQNVLFNLVRYMKKNHTAKVGFCESIVKTSIYLVDAISTWKRERRQHWRR